MGDLDSEPSMEDILSSIKRIIAEEGDAAAPRGRRMGRPIVTEPDPRDEAPDAEPLNDAPTATREPEAPQPEARPATFASVSPEIARGVAAIDPAILSPQVAEAARGRIEALSRMIVRPEVAGADTLEGLVRDMLKPMLTQWLDTNLPRIVEGIVEREIERISGRREG